MSSSDFRREGASRPPRASSFAWLGVAALSGRWVNSPFTLPTLSLVIAFSADPALRAINAPLMLWNAYPIALRAWRVWRREARLNVDSLDALAVAISLAQGDPLAGAIVTWLIKLGDWIRDLTAASSRRAISELADFQAKRAWVLRNGDVASISASDLVVGDEVVAHTGEIVPVDGEIIDGSAMVDQKTITGESAPVSRVKGDVAFAASVILEGELTVRAARVGAATNAAQIARLVESAPTGDTRIQNHAERFADRLVLPTLAMALGAALYSGDLNFVLSLLIVDFGTGIRVAAPTAALASMIRAARAGIIFKSGAHMERLAAVDTVIFDKTGTLTHGAPTVANVVNYTRSLRDSRLLALAVAAEARAPHPVAAAMRARAEELGLDIPPCVDFEHEIGFGVGGRVDGSHVLVGSERFMRRRQIDIAAAAIDRLGLDGQGYSYTYIAIDGRLAGLASYADEIRSESAAIIEALHAAGIKNTVLLTGDNFAVARAVGARLGFSRVFAAASPADKTDVIQGFQQNGCVVAMIGDGINDSPALSHADVGVSVRHGSEIARESADVILMEDSLWKLVKAIEISRHSVDLIKKSYAIVGGMNAQALALVLMGVVTNPVVTALISNGSAVIASLSAASPLFRRR